MDIKAPAPEVAAPQDPAAPAPAAEVKAEPASAKLELFAKKEAALVRRQQEIKALEQQYKQREERIKKYEDLETNKPDPVTLLQKYGYSYEDATNFVLNGNKATPDMEVRSVKEELEQFKKQQIEERENERKAQELKQKAQEDEIVANFKADMVDYLTEHKDEYELINLYDQSELVFATITDYFEKHKRALNVKEAAGLVERHLEDLLDKGTKTSKWQKKGEPQGTETPSKDPKTGQFQPTGKTLTNHMAQASSPTSLPAKTEADRIARALAALGD